MPGLLRVGGDVGLRVRNDEKLSSQTYHLKFWLLNGETNIDEARVWHGSSITLT